MQHVQLPRKGWSPFLRNASLIIPFLKLHYKLNQTIKVDLLQWVQKGNSKTKMREKKAKYYFWPFAMVKEKRKNWELETSSDEEMLILVSRCRKKIPTQVKEKKLKYCLLTLINGEWKKKAENGKTSRWSDTHSTCHLDNWHQGIKKIR